MRVLVSDQVSDKCLQLLRQHNVEVTTKYKMPKDQLIAELGAYDGLIVRSETKVTADVINAGKNLKIIGRAGTGVDNIDINAATEKGILVVNTPGGNSISACELTCSLISGLARNLGAACMSIKEKKWDRKQFMGTELYGKTLGVVGLGRIGREVASRMRSYGMTTIGFDPIVSAEDAKSFGVEKVELDQIWARADYITVHTPLIPQTKNLINKESLSKCKNGVKIVNVARGGIIDEVALLEALKNGTCGGAGIDVFTEEPPKSSHIWDLIVHPLVLATPHIGASTEEAQVRVAVEVAEQFVAFDNPKSSFRITGAVNPAVMKK